jgi:hypothetical protein
MEELPTGRFKGYCVTLEYNQPSGLCVFCILIGRLLITTYWEHSMECSHMN